MEDVDLDKQLKDFEKERGETVLEACRPLAEQGDLDSQVAMGLFYALGKYVLIDPVLAYMWFNIAALNGSSDGAKARDAISADMTPEQIAEAQKIAQEWLVKTPTNH